MKNYAWLLLVLSLSTTLFCKKSGDEIPEPGGPATLKDSVIVENLSYPWEILWGPDDHIWFTERGGRISRLNPATGNVNLIHTISEVASRGEGGLMGMVLHPQFTLTPQVFVVYNYANGDNYLEKIVRFTYNGTTLTAPLTLMDNIPAANTHNGSRLVITGDKLFITTGDAQNGSSAQNLSSPNGKTLRLNLDGSIPADNPLAGNPYWSSGHRNAQGLVFANNRLYSTEHGPNNDDEVNIIEKGRNYGWPNVEGFCNTAGEQSFCSANNIKEPLKAWTPTIAVSGLDYYNNDAIPQWKNSLLMTSLKDETLYQLELDDSNTGITATNTFFRGKYDRLRDICISPAGKVYVCTSNGSNDKIVEIRKN